MRGCVTQEGFNGSMGCETTLHLVCGVCRMVQAFKVTDEPRGYDIAMAKARYAGYTIKVTPPVRVRCKNCKGKRTP